MSQHISCTPKFVKSFCRPHPIRTQFQVDSSSWPEPEFLVPLISEESYENMHIKKKFTHQMEFNQNMCRWFLKDKIKIWKSFCSNLKKIRAFVFVLNLYVCVTSPVLRNWERGLWYCSLKSLLRIRKVRKYFKNIIIWRMILNPQNVWSILWKSIILKPKLPRINKTNLEVETKFSTKLLYLYISKIQNYT